ncbi:hypothetical protein SMICM17S_04931 [Streptomyces microflavus]
MEAVWRIEVEDFPAFIVVDDKGNDFFTEPARRRRSPAFRCRTRPGLTGRPPDRLTERGVRMGAPFTVPGLPSPCPDAPPPCPGSLPPCPSAHFAVSGFPLPPCPGGGMRRGSPRGGVRTGALLPLLGRANPAPTSRSSQFRSRTRPRCRRAPKRCGRLHDAPCRPPPGPSGRHGQGPVSSPERTPRKQALGNFPAPDPAAHGHRAGPMAGPAPPLSRSPPPPGLAPRRAAAKGYRTFLTISTGLIRRAPPGALRPSARAATAKLRKGGRRMTPAPHRHTDDLLAFIAASPSPYHVVASAAQRRKAGFAGCSARTTGPGRVAAVSSAGPAR